MSFFFATQAIYLGKRLFAEEVCATLFTSIWTPFLPP